MHKGAILVLWAQQLIVTLIVSPMLSSEYLKISGLSPESLSHRSSKGDSMEMGRGCEETEALAGSEASECRALEVSPEGPHWLPADFHIQGREERKGSEPGAWWSIQTQASSSKHAVPLEDLCSPLIPLA